MKKILKKTGKVVSAPVRIPAKKIKRHHEKKKAEKQIKKAINQTVDSVIDLINSKEFSDAMGNINETVKQAFSTVGNPEVVVDADPA